MPNVCADLLNGIVEFAAQSPLLACFMLLVLGAGTLLVGIFIYRIISRNYLAWFTAFAQSIPFAIMVALLANFALANGENYQAWWITITGLAFFVLPIIINNYMRQIHTGAPGSGQSAIVILGVIGICLWGYVFYQMFPDFLVFPSIPAASGGPGVSGGRP